MMSVTPRENLLRLLRREGYEAVPPEFQLCPDLEGVYRERESCALPYERAFGMPWLRIGGPLPVDPDRRRFHVYYPDLQPDDFIDEWGVAHRKTSTSRHMSQMFHPLERADSREQIAAYPLPVYDAAQVPRLAAEVEAAHREGLAAVGDMTCTIWETAWYLRGMENLMMDMLSDEPMAALLLDRVLETALLKAELFARAGVDILFLGDDVGMQSSVLMSLPLYCGWLKPRLKQVISTAKRIRPELLVFYHSCGYVLPFLPHWIECGVDVLNPVQPESMPFEAVFQDYEGALSFHGTIGTQSVLPFGTPEEVRREVWKNLKLAGPRGGLWPAPTHLLEPEVPWENIRAYVDACRAWTGA